MNIDHGKFTKRSGVYCKTHSYHGVTFEKSGILHRDNNQPAIIRYRPLLEEWRVEGVLHRTDGPARITDTAKEWWVDGKLHRFDGPAVETTNGNIEWWLFGKEYKFHAWVHVTVLDQSVLEKLILKHEFNYNVSFGL